MTNNPPRAERLAPISPFAVAHRHYVQTRDWFNAHGGAAELRSEAEHKWMEGLYLSALERVTETPVADWHELKDLLEVVFDDRGSPSLETSAHILAEARRLAGSESA